MSPISLAKKLDDGTEFYLVFNYESKELSVEVFKTENENKLKYLKAQSASVLMDSFMSREKIVRPEFVAHSYREDIDILTRFHKWSVQENPNKAGIVLSQLQETVIPILDKILREIGAKAFPEMFIISTLIKSLI